MAIPDDSQDYTSNGMAAIQPIQISILPRTSKLEIGCSWQVSLESTEMQSLQGKLVNETRCLRCETVTSREEAFYDLSLEIEQNSSLTACLRNFRYLMRL